MKRRGEISMEVIIIAAIALLVLVILAVLILRSGVGIGKGTSCEGVGGTCESDECQQGYARGGPACSEEGTFCCIPLTNEG